MIRRLPSSWFSARGRTVPPHRSLYVWRHPDLGWSFLPPDARASWLHRTGRLAFGVGLVAAGVAVMLLESGASWGSCGIAFTLVALVGWAGPVMADWQERTDACIQEDPEAFRSHAIRWAHAAEAHRLGIALPPAVVSERSKPRL